MTNPLKLYGLTPTQQVELVFFLQNSQEWLEQNGPSLAHVANTASTRLGFKVTRRHIRTASLLASVEWKRRRPPPQEKPPPLRQLIEELRDAIILLVEGLDWTIAQQLKGSGGVDLGAEHREPGE